MASKTREVLHVGPDPESLGGMASVIGTLVEAPKDYSARSVITWSPNDRSRGIARLPGAIMSVIRAKRAVIHAHVSERGSLVREGLFIVVGKLLRRRVIVTLHGAELADSGHHLGGLTRWLLKQASARTVLTQEQSLLLKRSGLDCRVITNPVKRVAIAPAAERADFFLFCGELSERKGVDVLLCAWPQVRSKHRRYELILAGPAIGGVPKAQEGVSYVGPVANEQVHALLARCQAAVLPSRREVLPMFLVEAMSQGRIWVSTRRDGMLDLASEGGGILVPAGDAQQLEAALLSIVEQDEGRRRLLEEQSFKAWRANHAPEVVARRYSLVYWPWE